MDRALELFLNLLTAVEGRDEQALRHVLRAVACELEEQEQLRVMTTLQESLDQRGRDLLERIR